MSKIFTVECEKRAPGSKPNALRREGKLPIVLYGHVGADSEQYVMDYKLAEFLVRDSVAKKSTIDITTKEGLTTRGVLQEVQKHPWKGSLYHLSFLVNKG